jgi:ribosomal protein L32E
MKVIWTRHAKERQSEWERRRGITRQQVERVVGSPDQVATGYGGTSVAQSRWSEGLLRVPFIEVEEGRKILTVYWTSRVEKYWEVNKDEDSV